MLEYSALKLEFHRFLRSGYANLYILFFSAFAFSIHITLEDLASLPHGSTLSSGVMHIALATLLYVIPVFKISEKTFFPKLQISDFTSFALTIDRHHLSVVRYLPIVFIQSLALLIFYGVVQLYPQLASSDKNVTLPLTYTIAAMGIGCYALANILSIFCKTASQENYLRLAFVMLPLYSVRYVHTLDKQFWILIAVSSAILVALDIYSFAKHKSVPARL